MTDMLVTGARIAPFTGGSIEVMEGADTIGITGGAISFLGSRRDAPAAEKVVEMDGGLVTPGLVDCHTHLVWAGDRRHDFLRRTGGATYAELAAGGGGILSTVAATRAAHASMLILGAANRMRDLARHGVTTVEVKSGYGMDTEAELGMLEAAATAAGWAGIRVERTLLGAHAVPTDRSRAEQVAAVCEEMIPAAAEQGLASAVDVFADSIAYSAEEADTIFTAARAHGLRVKAHVGQLADIGAAAVAARHRALSVDHCEHLTEDDVALLAEAGTVAVLVPGASLFLGESAVPPVEALRRHGVPLAVTTDLNPGSSPLTSLPLAGALAVHRFGLTPREALLGMTAVAADALGLDDGRGRIAAGGPADLALWSVTEPVDVVYWMGSLTCRGIVVGGVHHDWSAVGGGGK